MLAARWDGREATGMAEQASYIAVIDDDRPTVELFTKALERAGFAVRGYSDPSQGIYRLFDDPPAAIVVDLNMPVLNGFDFVMRMQASCPGVPIIVATGSDGDDAKTMARARREFGVSTFLRKPVSMRDLVRAVGKAVTTAAG
jgi:FixJ family two-component response regulator